ncbi:MAG: autotransporter-associated beta strand repeat-containing protein, partial [Kiritimatiellae bacterium]|nr:autotransporter-associated beta strand repeat-containing protein [Kiritimatiellia bacterium]
NLHIGGSHKGTLNQTGGTVDVNGWTSVGRYSGGNGFYNLHGGTFTKRGMNYADITVGELGTGVVSVANGGSMFGASSNGVRIATSAGAVGTVLLSPDGTVTTRRFIGGAGAGSLVFNGGTAKPYDALYTSGFVASSLTRATVTPYGGTFDTDGKGDFTFQKPLLAAANANEVSETLTHRWTFDGESLVDPLSGSAATAVGNVTWTNGAIRLNGGANGSSQVNLGTDVFPTDGRGATIEMWVTQRGYSFWSRIVQCGYSKGGADTNFFISANTGGEAANPTVWRFRVSNVAEINGKHRIEMNRMYHVAATFDPQPDGRWICRAALHDPVTGALIDELVYTSVVGWKFQNMRFHDGCWLGHSSYDADNDPNAEYHDIRIHHRALTEAQLVASATNGPACRFAFRKKGAGTLTLTGANTYKADTAVDGGTLKLASGASLPATGLSVADGATLDLNGASQAAERLEGAGTVTNGTLAVAGPILPGGEGTVGTLTLAGTALTSGTLVVDVAADGTCDKLVSTGTLDLSGLSLALGNADLNEEAVYVLATAAGFTGDFVDVSLPNKWKTFVQANRVIMAYANGTVMLVR